MGKRKIVTSGSPAQRCSYYLYLLLCVQIKPISWLNFAALTVLSLKSTFHSGFLVLLVSSIRNDKCRIAVEAAVVFLKGRRTVVIDIPNRTMSLQYTWSMPK
jgi:hypothetical protein